MFHSVLSSKLRDTLQNQNLVLIPKDVSDMYESCLNKAKEAGDVRNNITIVEPSGGTFGSKKIMISNLNHEKIRRIEVAIVELMESSDSNDFESDEDNLNWLLF